MGSNVQYRTDSHAGGWYTGKHLRRAMRTDSPLLEEEGKHSHSPRWSQMVFHQPYSSKSFNFGGIMLAFLHAKGTFPTYICLPAWAKIPSCPVQNCKVNWQKKFIFKEGSWALRFHMLLYQLIMQTEGVSISSWFAINTSCKSSLIRATYFNN